MNPGIGKREFIDIYHDRKFWQWTRNGAPKPYTYVTDKRSFLTDLYKKIENRTYYPSPPQEYLTLNKGNGVLRVIPALSLEDLCVYYFCVRKLEKFIAINRVSGTFGGFGLSGKLRKIEEAEMQTLTDRDGLVQIDDEHFIFANSSPYPSLSPLNPRAWFAEWNDFTKKLYFTTAHYGQGFVAEIDISNFYDSIQLDNLEYKLRRSVPHKCNDVVYLTMHFLRFWNRHINFYRQQGAGIPQDTFGECSRILANFYLQGYDHRISEYCRRKEGMFFRYADDQIIFAKSREDIEEIIAKASSLLMREGLNFNQKKVKIMRVRDFREYYCFENFMELTVERGQTIPLLTIQKQITFFLRHKNDLKKDGLSLLRRILGILGEDRRRPRNFNTLKWYLLSLYLPNNDRVSLSDLERIYRILDRRERTQMFQVLRKSASTSYYTDYLYVLRKFFRQHGVLLRPVSTRITFLKRFYGFQKLI
jgi:hypothetical protein